MLGPLAGRALLYKCEAAPAMVLWAALTPQQRPFEYHFARNPITVSLG